MTPLSLALAEGRAVLAAAGIENPFFEASLLLSHALGVRREQLYLMEGGPVSTSSRYAGFLERRASGECAAYILGRKEFRGLDFTVRPAVLVPRPDTETLVETALEAPDAPFLLDLCTGSGAVAIALKHELPEMEVWAADISAPALDIARENARRLLGKDLSVRFYQGDLFAALPPSPPRFSVITANAPYIPSAAIAGLSPEVRREPRIALDGGEDGLDLIRRIIGDAPPYLMPGGILLLEADPSQMETITGLLEARGFTGVQIRKDLSGNDRVISGRLP
jgi:release factor glutamine methyltransferase